MITTQIYRIMAPATSQSYKIVKEIYQLRINFNTHRNEHTHKKETNF